MTRLVESNKEVIYIAVNQKPSTTIGTGQAERRGKGHRDIVQRETTIGTGLAESLTSYKPRAERSDTLGR